MLKSILRLSLGGRARRVLGQRLAPAQHGHAPQLAHALAAEEALLVAQHGVRELVPRRAAASTHLMSTARTAHRRDRPRRRGPIAPSWVCTRADSLLSHVLLAEFPSSAWSRDPAVRQDGWTKRDIQIKLCSLFTTNFLLFSIFIDILSLSTFVLTEILKK